MMSTLHWTPSGVGLVLSRPGVGTGPSIEVLASGPGHRGVRLITGVADGLGALVGLGLPIGPGALVGLGLPVGPGALVGLGLPIGPGALVGLGLPVGLGSLAGSEALGRAQWSDRATAAPAAELLTLLLARVTAARERPGRRDSSPRPE
jgi:hypothetical protein